MCFEVGFEGSRRRARLNAILCWVIAAGVWSVQVVVVFRPDAAIIRQVFPD
jgi:hypothetical protein